MQLQICPDASGIHRVQWVLTGKNLESHPQASSRITKAERTGDMNSKSTPV